jgi:hypothetical protein
VNKHERRVAPPWFSLIGLVCFGVLGFAAARVGFFLDDWLHLMLARALPDPLDPFLRDRMLGAFFRPLGVAWWWLPARLGDPGAPARHVAAALLHAGGAALLGLAAAAWRDDRRVGWAAGLLWLTSPVAWSAVAWLACGYDLLAVFFSALALWRGLRYLAAGKRLDLALAVAATLLAAWSKESAYVLPLVALALAWSTRAGGTDTAERSEAYQCLPTRTDKLRCASRVSGTHFEDSSNRKWKLFAGLSAVSILALIHRRVVLGFWLGGYREAALPGHVPPPVWPNFFDAMHLQVPGWSIRFAVSVALCVALLFLNREKRQALLGGLAAALFAALPLLFLARSPSMLPVLPARYFVYGAFALAFPLAVALAAARLPKHLGALLLVGFMLAGTISGVWGMRAFAARTQNEARDVDLETRRAESAVASGRTLLVESARVVGIDAAVKAMKPDLLGRLVVLNCGSPTHVVVTPAEAARLAPYWSPVLPANPSRGFGLVWGEVFVPKDDCGELKSGEAVQPPR